MDEVTERSKRLSRVVDRFIRHHAISTYSHGLAVLLLAVAYLARHVFAWPPMSRHGGFYQFIATLFAWWPVLVSWRIVKEPNETTPSFVTWLLLFWGLTLAVCAIHIAQWPKPLAQHPFLTSVLHMLTLLAIAPLAIEKWDLARTRAR